MSAFPIFVALVLHLLSPSPRGGSSESDNRFVKVEASLANTLFHPGDKGKILVSFTPIDGIHINIDPPVELKIKKNSLIDLRGQPDMTADKETGFLSAVNPVEQSFSISTKAAPGTHSITGTITYFFCSDIEGWCRKQSQPVRLTLNIRRP